MMAGEPIVGIRTNGITQAAQDRARGVDGQQQARFGAGSALSSRNSSDAVGNASPRTIVTGSTTATAAENSTPIDTNGRTGSNSRGCEMTRTSPAMLRTATANCVQARTRVGFLIRGRSVLKIAAPSAMPMRNSARITVNT